MCSSLHDRKQLLCRYNHQWTCEDHGQGFYTVCGGTAVNSSGTTISGRRACFQHPRVLKNTGETSRRVISDWFGSHNCNSAKSIKHRWKIVTFDHFFDLLARRRPTCMLQASHHAYTTLETTFSRQNDDPKTPKSVQQKLGATVQILLHTDPWPAAESGLRHLALVVSLWRRCISFPT